MELAKMAKYAGLSVSLGIKYFDLTPQHSLFQTLCDTSFVIFMFMWTLRLGIFPSWIIYTTTVEAAHVRLEKEEVCIRFVFLS